MHCAPGVSAAAAGALQQVALSQTGAAAGELQQKSDLLSSIQTIVRNELHTNRTMDTETQNGSDESCEDTHATSQGKEYSAAHGKPDMSQYIKKDQIPCWGCSLDY